MREKVKILKIRKTKNGYFVRIPAEVVRELKLEEKEKVEVYIDRESEELIYKPF
ncbi:AbrB/MazE/SpoVT family DNA-binding domain-containing protein [candidate division WOR-3 bacterium]|nr:AbrB/MazE/SpoVT family DNA-binding domain-containing protein [candidate division WOR-3 bacterium]